MRVSFAAISSQVRGENSYKEATETVAQTDVEAAKGDLQAALKLAALNAMITDQAAMIAYIDDFQLMMVMTLVTIPFLLLIRGTRPESGERMAVAE